MEFLKISSAGIIGAVMGMLLSFPTDLPLGSSALIGAISTICTVALLSYYEYRIIPDDNAILKRGEAVFKRHRAELERTASDSFVAIDPRTSRIVTGESFQNAIAKGREHFGHMRFYVRPVSEHRIPLL